MLDLWISSGFAQALSRIFVVIFGGLWHFLPVGGAPPPPLALLPSFPVRRKNGKISHFCCLWSHQHSPGQWFFWSIWWLQIISCQIDLPLTQMTPAWPLTELITNDMSLIEVILQWVPFINALFSENLILKLIYVFLKNLNINQIFLCFCIFRDKDCNFIKTTLKSSLISPEEDREGFHGVRTCNSFWNPQVF